MADEKLTDQVALAVTPATGDLLHIIDISDTGDDPAGSSKKITVTNLINSTLSRVGNYIKQQFFGETTLSDGANISWDLDDNQVSKVTLAGNRTLDNPTNLQAGATYILRVIQDATGSRTLAFGSAYKFPGGTAPTLTTAASSVDMLTFVSDGTNMYGVSQLDFS